MFREALQLAGPSGDGLTLEENARREGSGLLIVGLGSSALSAWCWFWYAFHRRRWGEGRELSGWRAYRQGMAFLNGIVWGSIGIVLIILGLIHGSYVP